MQKAIPQAFFTPMDNLSVVRCLLRIVAQSRTIGVYCTKIDSFYISTGKPKRTILIQPLCYLARVGAKKVPLPSERLLYIPLVGAILIVSNETDMKAICEIR